MNISQENIDALNAVVTIDITKDDYEQKLETAIKSYRKKVTMPGFRPGQVPVALVKKMYGKSLLADEINRLVGETISNYIKEKELNILGEPLPSESMEPIDFDKEVNDIQFKFDLALAPEVNLELNDKIKVPYYTLKVTDEQLKQQRQMLLSRFTKLEKVEAAGEDSMLKGKLTQEGGYEKEDAVLSIHSMKGEKAKKALEGKKAGETAKFDIREAYADDSSYIAYALGISKEEADTVKGEYDYVIEEVNEYKDPELNQELYDNLFGKDVVKSEEEFEAKVKEIVATANEMEENYRFSVDVRKTLLDKLKLDMPEAFLKRWIVAVNKGNEKATPEVIEKEFPTFIEDLKWKVISNDIAKKNDIKVEQADILETAKRSTRAQFMQYGMNNIPDEMLTQYATQMLQKREQLEQIAETASNEKVVAFIKEKIKLDNKEVTRAEFGKLYEE